MKLLSATQLKEVDSYTMEHEPIASIDLMERAATACAAALARHWDKSHHFKILAGPGGNGGDALAVARLLKKDGYEVDVFLFNTKGTLSPDCATNKERYLMECGGEVHEVTSHLDPPVLTAQDVVVDGLFGIGQDRPLQGGFARLAEYINGSPAQVVSLDIPSGLPCDGNVTGPAIEAGLTLSIGLPKRAFMYDDCGRYLGRIESLDIGLMNEGLAAHESRYHTLDEALMRRLVLPRPIYGHKGSFGHALLLAGSYGMAGAAILATGACLRSGVGKITIHTPSCNNDILQASVPEAVLHHDAMPEQCSAIPEDLSPYNAIAFGPGVGTTEDTAHALHDLITHARCPLVLDADGLNLLSAHKNWLPLLPEGTILTPHPREFSRLFGEERGCYAQVEQAGKMAKKYSIYILLKGHHSALCTPEGETYFNTTGNDGMATAGSGDVLTGTILSLLAQGYTPRAAALAGTYLHGLAGDLAASDLSHYGLIASDLVRYLTQAFKKLTPQTL